MKTSVTQGGLESQRSFTFQPPGTVGTHLFFNATFNGNYGGSLLDTKRKFSFNSYCFDENSGAKMDSARIAAVAAVALGGFAMMVNFLALPMLLTKVSKLHADMQVGMQSFKVRFFDFLRIYFMRHDPGEAQRKNAAVPPPPQMAIIASEKFLRV